MGLRYKGRIDTKSILIITAIIVIIAVIAMLVFNKDRFNPGTNIDNPPVTTNNTDSGDEGNPDVTNLPISTSSQVASYDGYWVDMVMGGAQLEGYDLWVYVGNNDTISFECIDKDGNSFEAQNIDMSYGYSSFKDRSLNYSGTINFLPKIIELQYEWDGNGEIVEVSFEKKSTKVVSRKQIFDEIDKIINSNYTNIDKTIFRIKDGKEFLLLNLVPTCFVDNRELKSTYNGVDYIREVYTIDKYAGKLMMISDIIKNEQTARKVDNFVNAFLEAQKQEYLKLGKEWPYDEEYIGVLSIYNNNSKYFYVDEASKIVSVKIFDALPSNSEDKVNDLWCNIPFYLVFDEERLNRLGVKIPVAVPLSDGEFYSGGI